MSSSGAEEPTGEKKHLNSGREPDQSFSWFDLVVRRWLVSKGQARDCDESGSALETAAAGWGKTTVAREKNRWSQ
jgi:hypothetical protein